MIIGMDAHVDGDDGSLVERFRTNVTGVEILTC